MRLYTACRRISEVTPGYQYGGGHDRPISQVRGSQRLDCSSSVSRALYMAGFFPFSWSLISGGFAKWGKAGRGEDFTVWYNHRHVWIQFHGQYGGYRRFDTTPWGPGRLGPRIRQTPRPTTNFSPRHVPGH